MATSGPQKDKGKGILVEPDYPPCKSLKITLPASGSTRRGVRSSRSPRSGSPAPALSEAMLPASAFPFGGVPLASGVLSGQLPHVSDFSAGSLPLAPPGSPSHAAPPSSPVFNALSEGPLYRNGRFRNLRLILDDPDDFSESSDDEPSDKGEVGESSEGIPKVSPDELAEQAEPKTMPCIYKVKTEDS